LYASPDAAKNDKGPGSEDYLGTIPVVLNDRKNQHVHKRTRTVVVNISTQKFESLARSAAQLTLVERGAKEGARKLIPVTAGDLHFSVADVER
jgi:hypothetical protein